MNFFNNNTKEMIAPREHVDLAHKIMAGFNQVIDKHQKEIHLVAPKGVDKINFAMILTTMIVDGHCCMVDASGAQKKEKHLKNLVKGLEATWADKRNY